MDKSGDLKTIFVPSIRARYFRLYPKYAKHYRDAIQMELHGCPPKRGKSNIKNILIFLFCFSLYSVGVYCKYSLIFVTRATCFCIFFPRIFLLSICVYFCSFACFVRGKLF